MRKVFCYGAQKAVGHKVWKNLCSNGIFDFKEVVPHDIGEDHSAAQNDGGKHQKAVYPCAFEVPAGQCVSKG